METRNVKRKTNDRCAPLPKKWGRWICRCVCCQFFFWAVEDQRCGEALELGGHGHRNPPRCHADTRSDLDHDSGTPLQISTEIRTMYPNHVKRWGPHPERCPRLSRQAGQQGILTEPHIRIPTVARLNECLHTHISRGIRFLYVHPSISFLYKCSWSMGHWLLPFGSLHRETAVPNTLHLGHSLLLGILPQWAPMFLALIAGPHPDVSVGSGQCP